MRLLGVTLALTVALAGCGSSGGGDDREPSGLPTGDGPLATGSVTWAVGGTVHVDDRTIDVGERVRAMVGAHGRVYYLAGRSETLWVADGEERRRTDYATSELRASADGRYLGFLDHSRGMPWSTVVVDLGTGDVVVDDAAGMGGPDDDLADLYEDAEPQVLGFVGDDFFVEPATGEVLSWDVTTGERTTHGPEGFFATPDPGGGRLLPALVKRGRLVVPKDPYRSTQWGHQSPDGSLTLQPVGGGTAVFAVESGERLPVDLRGRTFVLGGWSAPDTAYGIAFDGASPYGRPARLVSCRLTLAERHCEVLRTVRPARHQVVLFPTGSPASY